MKAMSVRVAATLGMIVLLAMGAVDYQAAANARPDGQPLSLTAHIMDRAALASAAMGFAMPADMAPVTSAGKATAAIEAALRQAQGTDRPADTFAAIPAPVGEQAVTAAAKREFGKVVAAIDGTEPAPAPRKARKEKPGTITVGIGTCAKRGAGKFCSVAKGH